MPARKVSDEMVAAIRAARSLPPPHRPSLRELARELGLSWNTVRNAEKHDYRQRYRVRELDIARCQHGQPEEACEECYALAQQAIADRPSCPHGERPGECNACNVASDFAYDSWRESSVFGR